MTEPTVIDDWRERRDLVLAVKQRVEHQLHALNVEIVPAKGPDAGQQRCLDDLQFELDQLREALAEAEERYEACSRN